MGSTSTVRSNEQHAHRIAHSCHRMQTLVSEQVTKQFQVSQNTRMPLSTFVVPVGESSRRAGRCMAATASQRRKSNVTLLSPYRGAFCCALGGISSLRGSMRSGAYQVLTRRISYRDLLPDQLQKVLRISNWCPWPDYRQLCRVNTLR